MEDLAEAVLEKLEIQQQVVIEEEVPWLPALDVNVEHYTTDTRRLVRDKKIPGRFHLEVGEVNLTFIQGSWIPLGTCKSFRHVATFSSLLQGLLALRPERTEDGFRIHVSGEWICTLQKRDEVRRFVNALL